MSADILNQPRELPLIVTPALCSGKTYIVTGANVGLGLEASRHLVAVGAGKVIMAVRNLEAGEAARADVEKSTNTTGVAEVWQLDLSIYDSIRAFAAKAVETLPRIDAVIENAAVATPSQDKPEGHLSTLTVNVFGTFLLAFLLLPKLRQDARKFGYQPRLSVVTSGAGMDMGEFWKEIADDPIAKMDANEEIGMKSYPMSKILEVMAVRRICAALPVSRGGVIINTINPGVCETTLSRNAPQAFREHLKELWAKCGRTAECGSRTLLAGVVAGEESHGTYMSDCVPANEALPSWVDDTASKQAWRCISAELERVKPGCVIRALE